MFSKIFSFILSIVALFSGFAVSEDTDVIRYRDMPYGIRYERQILDLNIPKSVKGDANLLLFIHGGAWTSGSKDESRPTLDYYSGRGIVCAAINYRYCGNPNYADIGDIMDDISSALTQIKKTAAENGINLKGVMLTGGSAGAHLSLLYAYSKVSEAPITPVAVAAQCPATDLTDLSIYDGSLREINPEKWTITSEQWYKYLSCMTGRRITKRNIEKRTDELFDISPIKYVNESTVPTILAHGTKDSVLPYENSVSLDALLTEYGVEHEFITFTDAWHDLQGCDEAAAEYGKAFESYLQKYVVL